MKDKKDYSFKDCRCCDYCRTFIQDDTSLDFKYFCDKKNKIVDTDKICKYFKREI